MKILKKTLLKSIISFALAIALVMGAVPLDGVVLVARAADVTVESTTTAWATGNTYKVTSDVTIESRITVNGTVTLELGEGKTLIAKKGITVTNGNSLTITGTGTLFAGTTDGTTTSCDSNDAGIGGRFANKSGNITINGGIITAFGNNGAGIGGGSQGAGGSTTITGGTVTARSAYGAGIGGGSGSPGSSGSITITGGTVTATGGSQSAGIGGGWHSDNCGGVIKISGGTVTATGGLAAAGIGGGNNNIDGVNDVSITISGSANITATGGSDAAGIGGGSNCSGGSNITISGGTITATGKNNAAGIGSGTGFSGTETTVSVTGNTTMSANNMKKMEVSSGKTLTVPSGGTLGVIGTLTNNGTVTNNGTMNVGSSATLTNNGTVTNSGTMTVASGGTVEVAENATLTVSSAGSLTNNGSVTVATGGKAEVENGGTFDGTNPTGSGTIDGFKPTLTITAKDKTITYGDAPGNDGVTYSGFVDGDNAEKGGIFSGSLSYDYSYSQFGDAGSAYTITPKGLTSSKYNITFVSGTLTVEKKSVTVSGIKVKNKVYDGTKNATLDYSNVTFTGRVNNDDLTVTATGTFYGKNVKNNEKVGISNIVLGGAAKDNYTLSSTSQSEETADITPKSVTVKADNKTKTVGENDPEFTATVTGRVDGEADVSISYRFSRVAGETAGTYTITPAGETTQGNYSVTYETGTLTITNKPTYAVTVNNGSGDGSYVEGATITITADAAPEGQEFDKWTGTDGLTFTSGSATTATVAFTMPAKAVTVTATYKVKTIINPIITKVPAAITGLVYNGKAQALITAGEVTGGTLYYAVTKAGDPEPTAGLYTTSIPTATNAGSYYVWYKAVGETGQTEPVCVTVKIKEKAPAPYIPSTQYTPSDPAPAAENYTVPLSNENSVDVSANITEGNAVVQEITQADLDKIIGNDSGAGEGTKENKTITIDLSGAKSEVTSVELSGTSVEKLAETVGKSETVDSVEIKMTDAVVEMDGKAVSAISEQKEGDTVKLVVENKGQTKLNESQKEALKQFSFAKPFQAYFKSGGKEIHDFKGGKAKVSLRFQPEAGKDAKYYHMYYISTAGLLERYVTRYLNGWLTFITDHFSDYAIVYDESMENETGKEEVAPSPSPTVMPTETPLPTVIPTETPSAVPEMTATPEPAKTPEPAATITPQQKAKAALAINEGLKVRHNGNNATVEWGEVNGADSYKVYAAYCGSKFALVKAVKGGAKCKVTIKKLNGKKLSPTKNIKVYVAAYQKVRVEENGKTVLKDVRLAKTIAGYVVGKKNTKYSNAKKIELSKTSYTLKKGKKAKIQAKTVLEYPKRQQLSDAHAKEFRYASTDKSVAYVDKKGRIVAKKKGSCTIYIYARNGLARKIKVMVS